MSIVKHEVESCCGNKALSFVLDKCILQSHIPQFLAAGFIAPQHFIKAGIFYVDKSPIIASGAFNSKSINVRCSQGRNCNQAIEDFEKLLNDILK
jgi:hypothetical protein